MLDFKNNILEGYCSFSGDKVSDMTSCPCEDENDDYCIGDCCDMYAINVNDKIIKIVEESLKEDDYFDTAVFYYLSGRFPDFTIKQCVDIVDQIRKKTRLI